MVRQHAVSVRATGLTQTSLGAGSRRGAGAGVVVSPLRGTVLLAKFAGGIKTRVSLDGARRAGADGVVLGACRGVAGGASGLWQGLRYPRIPQGARVGELEPKLTSLGVGS